VVRQAHHDRNVTPVRPEPFGRAQEGLVEGHGQ
jgi:hypothetical protein